VAALGEQLVIVFAHAGHWLTGVAYAMPVFILLGWMGVVRFKDRRASRKRDA
jgi:hypothetical protein